MPSVTLNKNAIIAAERHHLAVGEVGQAGRAEDQRQPDRAHGDDQPEPHTVGEALRPLVERRLLDPLARRR